MIRTLLREGGREPVVHLQRSLRLAACGRTIGGPAGVWEDDDHKVTCPACCALRDASSGHVAPDPRADTRAAAPGSGQPLRTGVNGLDRLLAGLRLELVGRHRQPRAWRVALATVVAVAGSLLADALLVAAGTALFPSTRHYGHFQFPDYARLTVVGVLAACVAWPVVTRVTRSARWLFLRLAVLVTLVLWLPDAYILWRGQPAKAVAVLMVMHLAVAVVTYNALVRFAPPRSPLRDEVPEPVG